MKTSLVILTSIMLMITIQASGSARAASVTYRMCTGEYEDHCPGPHDVYQYCYFDVKRWADAMCGAPTVQRYSVTGGNKCGYDMWMIICDNPKSASDAILQNQSVVPQ
ncbi:hypothetical protein [Rhizobium sp. CNPSo 3490]|uniref:hypothetical protein n=1 Tax=Rhizobium sp. CNPSo 3490 TaxID=3021407 RepID=UPI00254A5EAF|nr:hypothetical protein [Rhizobium sp. CNPSo 3490]MDK4733533.1 hypothetical protein [Rhizobium sp. CNPSo 3490]